MTFGTDPHKLARLDSPATSVLAANAVDTVTNEELVYRAVYIAGERGATQDEVLAQFAGTKPYSTITARFKALLTKGYVYDTGETRTGRSGKPQRVLRAKPHQPKLFLEAKSP